jgi:hypothetical protein
MSQIRAAFLLRAVAKVRSHSQSQTSGSQSSCAGDGRLTLTALQRLGLGTVDDRAFVVVVR